MRIAYLFAASVLATACANSEPKPAEVPIAASATPAEAATAAAPSATPSAAPVASAAPAAPAVPQVKGPDLVVAPMVIKYNAKLSIELKADKSITVNGTRFASFDKNSMTLVTLRSDAGKEVSDTMWIGEDGSVSTPPQRALLKFADKDELRHESGLVIAIDDKGNVKITLGADSKLDKKITRSPKITGFKPEARRAAALAVLTGIIMEEHGPLPKTEKDLQEAAKKANAH
ncbi:Hypothetical protein A7982_02177 [Minicystis rosea]|nr:Hypothetical protein A7982_02177 [Minicystis rosea]